MLHKYRIPLALAGVRGGGKNKPFKLLEVEEEGKGQSQSYTKPLLKAIKAESQTASRRQSIYCAPVRWENHGGFRGEKRLE